MFITAISAALFSVSSTFGCYYVQVDATYSSRDGNAARLFTTDPETGEGMKSSIGLYMYEDAFKTEGKFNWVCYPYEQEKIDTFDDSFQTARAVGIVGVAVLGIAMIFLTMTCSVQYRLWFLRLSGILMIVGGAFQAATFIIYQSDLCSDFDCQLYLSGYIAIACAITAWATAILAFCLPPSVEPFTHEYDGPARDPFEPGTVTETETSMPDGTTKITRTTVNPDGSKTIEETVYDPPTMDGDEEQFDDDGYD